MGTPPTTGHRPGRPARKSTPVGIMALCVFSIFGAIYGLLYSFALLGQGGQHAVIGLFTLSISIGQIAVVYGLWTIQSWGWTLGVIFYLLGVFFNNSFNPLIDILYAVIIVYLLAKHEYYHS